MEGAGAEGSPDWLRGSPDECRKARREVNEQEVMNGREGMEALHRAESKDRVGKTERCRLNREEK